MSARSRDDIAVIYEPPRLAAGTVARGRLRVNQELIYDVTYTLEDDYARSTGAASPEAAVGTLLFFGGSFTFGEGVEDTETFPAIVARELPRWSVRNYSFPGHGPAHMLLRLEDGETLRKLGGTRLVVCYTLIPGHVRRTIGSMRIATSWGRDFPYYSVNRQGDLVYEGTFSAGRPWLGLCYTLLAKEQILRFYNADLPPVLRPRHLERTARVIQQAHETVLSEHPGARFFVLIYPRHPTDEYLAERMIPLIEALGVEVLDYTDHFADGKDWWLPHDLHPNREAHREIGLRLADDLQSLLQP